MKSPKNSDKKWSQYAVTVAPNHGKIRTDSKNK